MCETKQREVGDPDEQVRCPRCHKLMTIEHVKFGKPTSFVSVFCSCGAQVVTYSYGS